MMMVMIIMVGDGAGAVTKIARQRCCRRLSRRQHSQFRDPPSDKHVFQE